MRVAEILRALGPSPWIGRLRRTAVAAITVAAAVNFGLFAPAFRSFQVAALEQAKFDLWVNGPMDEATMLKVVAAPASGASAPMVDITPRYLEHNGNRAVAENGRFADDAAALESIYPIGLLLEGEPVSALGDDGIALDRLLADSLVVAPGDEVVMNFMDGDGQEFNVTRTVRSIYGSSGPLQSSIGGLAVPDVLHVLANGGSRYSSVYQTASDPDALRTRLASSFGNDLQYFMRADMLNEARARANQVAEPVRELLLVALASLILVVVLIRDLNATMGLRSRQAAVLIALGVTPTRIARALALEQFGVIAAALAIGAVIGLILFGQLHLPVPMADLWLVITYLAVMAVAASVAVIVVARRRLATVPITRLLFEVPA
jgi:FtsX-like permease family